MSMTPLGPPPVNTLLAVSGGKVDVSDSNQWSKWLQSIFGILKNVGPISGYLPTIDGQILIGATGLDPVLANILGTANRVIVTNGPGSIQLSGPQDIAPTSSPTFAGITLSGLTPNSFLYSGVGGLLTATVAPTNGQLLIGSTGNAPVAGAITGTAHRVTVTLGAGTIALTLPQDIDTTSSPTFAGLTLSGLTAKSFLFSGVGGLLTTTAAPTNGQMLIGSTGNSPVLGAIAGTANQITVTLGAGTVTLSLPQSIATTSNVTFNNVTANGTLTAPTITGAGAMSIGNTGGSDLTITGSADLVLAAGGNIKFGTFSAIGAEVLTGYITIKDSGGTSRKLGVIA